MPETTEDRIIAAFMKLWGLWKDGGPLKLWYEGQLDGMIAFANEYDGELAEKLLERKDA